jgi:hypothetical protein
MKKNVGGLDKTLRIVLGIGLVLVALFAPIGTGWRIGVAAVAAVALVTAFTGL